MPTIVWRVTRRQLTQASVRYRALLPALSLEAHGYRSVIADIHSGIPLESADVLVISKSFSIHDIELARRARESGKPVVLDLCDNVFIADYGIDHRNRPADVFREMARYTDAVTCTTEPLAVVLREQVPSDVPVRVIADSIETPALLKDEARLLDQAVAARAPAWRRLQGRFRAWRLAGPPSRQPSRPEQPPAAVKTILWFGNHGSAHGDFGLADVLRFGDALAQIARQTPCRLLIVTNNRERFDLLISPLAIPSEYREWSPETLDRALAEADVVIAPNSLDPFSICKSANRTVLALQAGVPVVATNTPALQPLLPVVWTADPLTGIQRCLTDRDWVAGRLQLAQDIIERQFSLRSIGLQWAALMQSLGR